MRPALYWSVSLLIGLGVGAVTWMVAGWHVFAVGIGLVYLVGFGLLLRTHYDLRSRVDGWKRPSLWSGAFGGIVTFTALLAMNTSGLAAEDGLAVGLAVFGAGTVGLAAGVGMTLENLDEGGPDTTDSPGAAARDSARTDDSDPAS